MDPLRGSEGLHDMTHFRPLLEAIVNMPDNKDASRVFHGRGGCFPGLEHITLDWLQPVFLLVSFSKELSEHELSYCCSALEERWKELSPGGGSLNLVYQYRATSPPTVSVLCGAVPEPHIVTERGSQYLVHLLRGQNHGKSSP